MKKYLLPILFMSLLYWSCEDEAEPKDCAGIEGGSALVDNCGTCDDDPSNDCVEDCAGVLNGTAVFDDCGICDSDSTNDCFTPLTKEELQTAVDIWIEDNETALETYGEINNWNVSLITDMSFLFHLEPTFNSDIKDWDVSGVTNMSQMFDDANIFNQDLSNWDVSNVTDMYNMFENAFSLSAGNKCAIHASFSLYDAWPYDWSTYCD